MSATKTANDPAGSIDQLPFVKTLASVVRAEDSYGAWDRKTDGQILEEFIVTKEQRREIPIIGDPDPDVLHRVEQFYQTIGLRIEQRVRLMASPMMSMSHEGFGRVILTTGRLVVYVKTLRDVHRFGFEDFQVLETRGEKAVQEAIDLIERYEEVARA